LFFPAGVSMEIVFEPQQTHYSVSIVYFEKEWRNLESRYKDNGYEFYTTRNLFGRNITADVYRYNPDRRVSTLLGIVANEQQRLKKLSLNLGFADDINKPPFYISTRGVAVFNLAVFRIIPAQRGDKLLTVFDVPLEFINIVSDEAFTVALAVIGRLANPEFKRIRVLIE
jgi:hypothetical protein